MKELRGVLTAMATPFAESGGVDLDGARRLAAHILEDGSHGLVIAGTTGECPTLTDGEEIELLQAVRAEVGDDALLICGTGTNDTQHSCELTQMAAEAGADASLVVVPYYNKPNRAGIRAHFETVAAAVPELPMVMYNIPSRVIVNADPELLAELGRDVPNIVAVKQSNADELGPIEGSGRPRRRQRDLLRHPGVRRCGRRSRRLQRRRPPDAGDLGRGASRRPGPCPCDRRRIATAVLGARRHRPTRFRSRLPLTSSGWRVIACACRSSGATTSSAPRSGQVWRPSASRSPIRDFFYTQRESFSIAQ